MKKSTVFTALFTVGLLLSFRGENKATLKIRSEYCSDDGMLGWTDIKLLRDGKQVEKKQEDKEKFIFEALEKGTYTIVYKSIFNTQEQKTVEITEAKQYEVNVCLDAMDYSKQTYKPVIDRLKDGEYYTVYADSRGCFHWTQDELKVKRVGKNYQASWNDHKKILTETEKEMVRHFEMELNRIEGGGCTTETNYKLLYEGHLVTKAIDGTCHWGGIYDLTRTIFGADK